MHADGIIQDVISLTIQGVGGATAAMAAGNQKDPTTGGNIMLAGIIMQMGSFFPSFYNAFTVLNIYITSRYHTIRHPWN
jgi:hypothetical protein